MAKKLVTSNFALVTQVENVLKEKAVPYAWVQLKNKEQFMLVVRNRHGEEMRKAISECPVHTNAQYHFGVLRNHPEYTVPRGILKELADEEQKN